MRTKRFTPMLGLGLAFAALAVTSPRAVQAQATAQPDAQSLAKAGDGLWLPWLGCWRAEGAPSDAGLLCVRPGSDRNSVEVLRMKGADVESREVVWADGQRHETSRDGCNGWEDGTFSKDGRRVFLNSKHTCEGGVVRTGGGIMALVSPTEWLDVRYIGMGDSETPWVQRYRLASQEQTEAAGMGDIVSNQAWSVRAARMSAANAPDVNAVIEASKAEPAPVVQAWLAERKAPLKLDAKALERMADAGVAPSVTDMAIAISYPNHFRVNTRAPGGAAGDEATRADLSPWGYYSNPYFYDPFWDMYGFSPFGYAYSPYYRYGYGYYGGYYGGYGYSPIITITNTDQTPRQHGRVIAGRGYTQGGYTGSTGSSAGRSTAPARSSGSTGSTAGSSSSGSSTGRTAHRRGGGGGGL